MREIPRSEYKFSFSKSSGAGGQSVNKLNTRATLTWDMDGSDYCRIGIKKRFLQKYQRFIFEGKVVISSERFRSQKQNIEDCIFKLNKILKEIEHPPKIRKPTKPSRNSIKRRLDSKTKHSSKKKIRSEKF